MAIAPVCVMCGRRPSAGRTDPPRADGDWIRFLDYAPLVSSDPDFPVLGDDEGKAFFCGPHLAAAQAMASMRTNEAIAALKTAFADEPAYRTPEPVRKRRSGWFGRLFGSRSILPE